LRGKSFHAKYAKETQGRKTKRINENELSNIVNELAIRVHKALGPGLHESKY
jgi:hypothetical protein